MAILFAHIADFWLILCSIPSIRILHFQKHACLDYKLSSRHAGCLCPRCGCSCYFHLSTVPSNYVRSNRQKILVGQPQHPE